LKQDTSNEWLPSVATFHHLFDVIFTFNFSLATDIFFLVFFPMTTDSSRHVLKGIIMECRRRRRKVLKDKIAKNVAGEEVRKSKQMMITDIGSPSSSVQLETIPFCLAGHLFDFQFDT
jgi:hypothetical protein